HEPYQSASIGADLTADLRAREEHWTGFANRARDIVYNTARMLESYIPQRLQDLTQERFRVRVRISRPQFGTTRGHLGYLLHECGEAGYRAWVEAMKANDIRVFDGNATVVRAVAQGEVDVGLTDTDDVWAGQRNNWPVDLV